MEVETGIEQMKSHVCRLAVFLFALGMALSEGIFAEVSITRLANEGVILDDGVTRIMIDGMVVEPYSLYGGLPPGLASQFEFARGVFADVDLALASHRHHDHNQPVFSCIFMRNSTATRLYSSRQVLELMRERCRNLVTTSPRVTEIDPGYNEPVEITAGTATVNAFLLSHGTGKYAQLQNYGHLVHMGGLKILHIGDAAMDPADFEVAGLDQVELDVVLIPFWFFQPGPGMAVVERFMDAPHKLAVHIPPGEMAEVRDYLSENYPDVQVLVEPGDSMVVSPSPVTTSEDGLP
jgi:L-ascorbate metabolism protein UlaG (beta-lactamase superfamily)